MIEARLLFLLLTAILLALLVGIAVQTYRKKSKQKLEEPKFRMLDDD
ncbi:MAG TPA: hypothetical protein HPP76_02370 [Desulfuromonadales bacterium]|nr:hypothetical protein [Desulfuromonadales bacterium]